MKYIVLFLTILINHSISSQIFSSQQIITDFADGTRSIWVMDIDGDGIDDVISANKNGSSLTWFKHMDGQGNFGSQNMIGFLNQTISCYVADLDGDDDMDVLGVSGPDNMVVWFENSGNGTFSSPNILTSNFNGAYEVTAADIDGDEDLDIIASADDIDTIGWFENLNGGGDFGPLRIIATTGNGGRSFRIGDIDGDSDLDVVASSGGAAQLTWFENIDGQGTFAEPNNIELNGLAVTSIHLSDIDDDNDLDIIGGVFAEDKVVWYENLDGEGNFGASNLISSNSDAVRSVNSADLDMDNEIDVLSASVGDLKLAWYKNEGGTGDFGMQQIIASNVGISCILVNDLDSDGDMDVLVALTDDDTIAWYENLTILNVDSNIANKVSIVPNPVEDSFRVQSDYPVSNVRVMNAAGMLLLEVKDNFEQIPIKNLQTGMYLVEVEIEHHKVVKKLVKQ